MADNPSEATCHLCSESDDRFYHGESIEEGDTVEAKHFKGVVQHVGVETQVEVKESARYDNGEQIHIDKAYLRTISQTTL